MRSAILFLFLCSTVLAQEQTVLPLDSLEIVLLTGWARHYTQSPDNSPLENSDFSWEESNPTEGITLINKSGFYWYKKTFRFKGALNQVDVLAVQIFNLPHAYTLYWDGVRIGDNGITGTDEEEIPGHITREFLIPQHMSFPGVHEILLKVSRHRWINEKLLSNVTIGYISAYESDKKFFHMIPANRVSIYFLSLMLCLALYLGGVKHKLLLYHAGYSLSVIPPFLLMYAEVFGWCNVYLYHWLATIGMYIVIMRYILLLLFVKCFFEFQLRIKYILLIGLLLFVMSFLMFMGQLNFIMHVIRTALVLSILVIIFRQLKKKIPGGRLLFLAFIPIFIDYVYGLTLFSNDNFIFDQYPVVQLFVVGLVWHVMVLTAIMVNISEKYQRFQVISFEAELLKNQLNNKNEKTEYVVYRENNKNHLIPVRHIRYFKAERYLAEAHLVNGHKELMEKPLKKIEQILPNHFVRIHRSFIVNLDYVISYGYVSGGMYEIQLKQGGTLPVSRSKIKELKHVLKN